MALLRFATFALVLASVSTSWAGPPLDLTDPNATPVEAPKKKILSERDIVYVDDTKGGVSGAAVIVFDVQGRAYPSRKGKVLQTLKRGEVVRTMRPSKDGRWLAVHHIATGRRLWVPKGAVRDPKTLSNPKP